MKIKRYCDELATFLISEFAPAGYRITKHIELDPIPESAKYQALIFSLNNKSIIYRRGKVTADRPGAFLAIWRRSSILNIENKKPIPFKDNELDYLFIRVDEYSNDTDVQETIHKLKSGMFIFPTSLLIKKGIVTSEKNKGKTGIRVFPPWTQDRGTIGTKVFSESGKQTQRWQLPYFVEINDGSIDRIQLNKIFESNIKHTI